MVTIAGIRSFCEVAHCGSFSAAARATGASVASVSRHVSDLETDLGVRLLTRSTRSLALTDAGENFFRRASSLLEDMDELFEETRSLHATPKGKLRLSAPIAFGSVILSPLLPAFQEAYPEVEVELDISTRNVNLLDDQVDVAFRVEGPDGLKDSALIAKKLFPQRMIFVATPEYTKAHGSPQHPDELKNHRIVQQITGTFGRRWVLENVSEQIEMRLPGKVIVTSPLALLHASLSGNGIALMLDYLVEDALQDGRLLHIMQDWSCPNLPIHLVYVHRTHIPGKIQAFTDFVMERLSKR